MNPDSRKHGFTLVEIAVVLVIIGLIIGGVMVTTNMINSAKVQQFVKQISEYDAALVNFYGKYQSLPGDTNVMMPRGNNNGVIEGYNDDDNHFWGENANYWYHLSMTGFLPEQYSNSTAGGIVAGVQVPRAAIGNFGNVGIMVGSPVDLNDYFTGKNVYWVSGFPQATVDTWGGACGGCLLPFTAYEVQPVDSKIDDGFPKSGRLVTASSAEFNASAADNHCATAGNAYNHSTAARCSINLLLGITVGEVAK